MSDSILKLPGICDLSAAAPMRSDLLKMRGGPVEIDAGDVQRLGGLCLQVLMAARATWQADGKPFAIIAASDAFHEGLRLFGIADLSLEPALEPKP